MGAINLHPNARTTPKIRAEIQASSLPVKELAAKYSISQDTVRKWKKRSDTVDRSHTRHNLAQSTNPEEEEIIIELRQKAKLSYDDIVAVMRECINSKLSRSAIFRCLKRNGATKILPVEEEKEKYLPFEKTEFGFVHIDLKQLTRLQGKLSFVFVAIERITRFVYVETIDNKRAETISGCLKRFLSSFKEKQIHTILTDNGAEFTDRRFLNGNVIKKPTGKHLFDLVCKEFGVEHRLTKPYHPQTNGMVERFNRRLNDVFARRPVLNSRQNKFINHMERNQFVLDFIDSYNRTKLKCLSYISPNKALCNQTELYNSRNLR